MSTIETPDGQTLIAIFVGFMTTIFGWLAKRWIGRLDKVEAKVAELDKHSISREELSDSINGLRSAIGTVHTRVDDIYREMPKGISGVDESMSS